jgi:hypothetical protein
MWTKYMLVKSTTDLTSWKHENIKTTTSKNNPPPSAVGFTHSGDEAPLVKKKQSNQKAN